MRVKFTELAKFQPKQKLAFNKLFNNQCKYLLYGGAAHGGKSYFLRWAAFGLGLYYTKKYGITDIPMGLFSEDYPTLKDRQIVKIKSEFPKFLGELKETRDEGLCFRASPEYGSFVILLRNLDDPSKYASTEFAAIFVEELTKNPVSTFEDLKFRLRYPGIKETKFVGATNPGQLGHSWVKKLWIQPDPNNPDKEEKKYFFVHANAYDNKYTEDGYIDTLKSLPDAKRKAWLEGSWDVFEGQVFAEWSERTHVITPFTIPNEWKRWIAVDWGSNKPFSVGWYAQDFDGRTYLYRELYMNQHGFLKTFGEELTAKRLAKAIIGMTKKAGEDYEYCIADPSMWNKTILGEKRTKPEGESIAEIMIDVGLNLYRGDNDRLNGLGRYREALAIAPDQKPWYQVFRSCYDTARTIPSLVYNEPKHGNIEDVNTNGEDHCYDRDRYFFMSRPIKPIKMQTPKLSNIGRAYREATKKWEEPDHEEETDIYQDYL